MSPTANSGVKVKKQETPSWRSGLEKKSKNEKKENRNSLKKESNNINGVNPNPVSLADSGFVSSHPSKHET